MLSVDVGAVELDVLGKVELRGAYVCEAIFDVVEEALRHRRVLVEVHEVGCLEE